MEQQFYKDLFDQDVTVDLGWNKTLNCGLVLQEHFDEIAGFPPETMKYRSNTMELYFETEESSKFYTLRASHYGHSAVSQGINIEEAKK